MLNENQIVDMYKNQKYTLRHLADIFNTNHHTIKRVLLRHNVNISKRKTLKPYSEERKLQISKQKKGNKYLLGKKAPELVNRKNMVGHMKV